MTKKQTNRLSIILVAVLVVMLSLVTLTTLTVSNEMANAAPVQIDESGTTIELTVNSSPADYSSIGIVEMALGTNPGSYITASFKTATSDSIAVMEFYRTYDESEYTYVDATDTTPMHAGKYQVYWYRTDDPMQELEDKTVLASVEFIINRKEVPITVNYSEAFVYTGNFFNVPVTVDALYENDFTVRVDWENYYEVSNETILDGETQYYKEIGLEKVPATAGEDYEIGSTPSILLYTRSTAAPKNPGEYNYKLVLVEKEGTSKDADDYYMTPNWGRVEVKARKLDVVIAGSVPYTGAPQCVVEVNYQAQTTYEMGLGNSDFLALVSSYAALDNVYTKTYTYNPEVGQESTQSGLGDWTCGIEIKPEYQDRYYVRTQSEWDAELEENVDVPYYDMYGTQSITKAMANGAIFLGGAFGDTFQVGENNYWSAISVTNILGRVVVDVTKVPGYNEYDEENGTVIEIDQDTWQWSPGLFTNDSEAGSGVWSAVTDGTSPFNPNSDAANIGDTFTLRVTCITGNTYYDTGDLYLPITVGKVKSYVRPQTGKASLEYSGAAQKPDIDVYQYGIVEGTNMNSSYVWTDATTAQLNVGTYDLVLSHPGAYGDTYIFVADAGAKFSIVPTHLTPSITLDTLEAPYSIDYGAAISYTSTGVGQEDMLGEDLKPDQGINESWTFRYRVNDQAAWPETWTEITNIETQIKAVGLYQISYNFVCDPESYGNYVSNGACTVALEITKRALSITADNKETTYGEAAPAFTVTGSGFAYGETLANLGGVASYTCSYDIENPSVRSVTTYDISVTGLTSDSYNISFNNGTLTVNKRAVTYTVDAKESVYGTAQTDLSATLTTGTLAYNDAMPIALEVWEQYNVSDPENKIIVAIGTTTPVGEYNIIAGGIDGNYDVTIVNTVKYNVTPATITVTTLKQLGTLSYNGSAQTPALDVTVSSVNAQEITYLYSKTEGSGYVALDEITYTNVLDCGTLYYKLSADNHNDATGSFTITMNKVNAAWTAPSAKVLTYDGNAQVLVNAPEDLVGVATVEYSLTNEEESWSTSIPTGLNAGEYNVYVRTTGDNNHNDNLTAVINLTMARYTVVPTFKLDDVAFAANTEKTYKSANYTITAVASVNLTINEEQVNKTIVFGQYASASQKVVGKLTLTVPAGNYPAQGDAENNYCVAEDVTSPELTIIRADFIVTPTAGQHKTYGDGDPSTYASTTSGKCVGDDITYYGSVTRDAGEDVGTYSYKQGQSYLAGDDVGNYNLVIANGTFEIVAKEITVTLSNLDNQVYDGNAKEATAAINGLIAADEGKASVQLSYVNDLKNTGSYYDKITFTIVGEKAGNYSLVASTGYTVSDGVGSISTFTILPATLVFGWNGLSQSDAVYDGGEKSVTAYISSGIIGQDVVSVDTYFNNADFKNVATDLGSYTAKIHTLAGNDAYNYTLEGSTGVTYAWAITALPITYKQQYMIGEGEWTDYVGSGVTYAGENIYFRVVPTNKKGTDDVSFLLNGQSLRSAISASDDSYVYTLTLSGVNKDNYYLADSTGVEYFINKANYATTVGIQGWTYGDAANNPNVTTNPEGGNASFLYKVKDANDDTYTADVPTDAGNYTVKGTIEATANYNSTSATVDFTIARRTIIVSGVTANDKTYDGNTNATFNYTNLALTGRIDGEDDEDLYVTIAGTFEDANVKKQNDKVPHDIYDERNFWGWLADNKIVTVSSVTLVGLEVNNYVLSDSEGIQVGSTMQAKINPKVVSFKIYLDNDQTEMPNWGELLEGNHFPETTYDGNEHTFYLKGEGVNEDVSINIWTSTNAGSASFYHVAGYTLADYGYNNYTMSKGYYYEGEVETFEWTDPYIPVSINRYTITPYITLDGVPANGNNATVVYDGQEHTFTLKAEAVGGTINIGNSIQSTNVISGTIPVEEGQGIGSNYRINADATFTYSITARPLTIVGTIDEHEVITYGNEPALQAAAIKLGQLAYVEIDEGTLCGEDDLSDVIELGLYTLDPDEIHINIELYEVWDVNKYYLRGIVKDENYAVTFNFGDEDYLEIVKKQIKIKNVNTEKLNFVFYNNEYFQYNLQEEYLENYALFEYVEGYEALEEDNFFDQLFEIRWAWLDDMEEAQADFVAMYSQVIGEHNFGIKCINNNYVIETVFDDNAKFSIARQPVYIVPAEGQSKIYGEVDGEIVFVDILYDKWTYNTDTQKWSFERVSMFEYGNAPEEPSLETIFEQLGVEGKPEGDEIFEAPNPEDFDNEDAYNEAMMAFSDWEDYRQAMEIYEGQYEAYTANMANYLAAIEDQKELTISTIFEGSLSRVNGENAGIYDITLGSLKVKNLPAEAPEMPEAPEQLAVVVPEEPDPEDFDNEDAYNQAYELYEIALQEYQENVQEMNEYIAALSAYSLYMMHASYYYLFELNVTEEIYEIAPKAITVTADDKTSVYGDADAVLTAKVTPGLVGNDKVSDVCSLSRVAGNVVGEYVITAAPANNANYIITTVQGTYTITAKPITVVADNKTSVYGEADVALTAKVTPGLVGNDKPYTLSRVAGKLVGEYTITVVPANDANYIVTPVNGVYTITAKPIIVTADNKTSVYGAQFVELTASLSTELVEGDSTADLFTLSKEAGEVAGEYVISVIPANNVNYSISTVPGTYTITAKPITITADNKESVYGAQLVGLTATLSTELVEGDTAADVYTLRTEAVKDAGSFTIYVVPANNANYAVTPVNGVYTIKEVAPTTDEETGVKTYTKDIPVEEATKGVSVTDLFKSAKDDAAETKEVKATVGTTSIVFDKAAIVAASGVQNAKLVVEITESDAELEAIADENLKGSAMIISISLANTEVNFGEGKVTVTADFDKPIPKGMVAKVYYVDANGNRTNMNATFANGKVTFETSHFSNYVVVYEKAGLSTGAIAGIIIACVVVLALVAFLLYWFVFRKKKTAGKATEKAEEPVEEKAVEEAAEEPAEETVEVKPEDVEADAEAVESENTSTEE